MEFEFDSATSEANKAKHAIDFNEAISVVGRREPDRGSRPHDGRARFLVVGRIAGKLWSSVITYRSEKIRIVSVRRSRLEEVKLYEGEGE
jgi:uncharacterized DUF497 family protein